MPFKYIYRLDGGSRLSALPCVRATENEHVYVRKDIPNILEVRSFHHMEP